MNLKNYKLAKRHSKRGTAYDTHRIPSHIRRWFMELGWKMPRERLGGSGYGSRGSRKIRILFMRPPCPLVQICDGDFDRWANSVGAQQDLQQWPKTKTELRSLIKDLKANALTFKQRMTMLDGDQSREVVAEICGLPPGESVKQFVHSAEIADSKTPWRTTVPCDTRCDNHGNPEACGSCRSNAG